MDADSYSITENPAAKDEVVLWRGDGYPVYSVEQAVTRARRWAADEEGLDSATRRQRAAVIRFRRDKHPRCYIVMRDGEVFGYIMPVRWPGSMSDLWRAERGKPGEPGWTAIYARRLRDAKRLFFEEVKP